jgi:hypothetical protein
MNANPSPPSRRVALAIADTAAPVALSIQGKGIPRLPTGHSPHRRARHRHTRRLSRCALPHAQSVMLMRHAVIVDVHVVSVGARRSGAGPGVCACPPTHATRAPRTATPRHRLVHRQAHRAARADGSNASGCRSSGCPREPRSAPRALHAARPPPHAHAHGPCPSPTWTPPAPHAPSARARAPRAPPMPPHAS